MLAVKQAQPYLVTPKMEDGLTTTLGNGLGSCNRVGACFLTQFRRDEDEVPLSTAESALERPGEATPSPPQLSLPKAFAGKQLNVTLDKSNVLLVGPTGSGRPLSTQDDT